MKILRLIRICWRLAAGSWTQAGVMAADQRADDAWHQALGAARGRAMNMPLSGTGYSPVGSDTTKRPPSGGTAVVAGTRTGNIYRRGPLRQLLVADSARIAQHVEGCKAARAFVSDDCCDCRPKPAGKG